MRRETATTGGASAEARRQVKVIRSKNAGPTTITLDLLFSDEAGYKAAFASEALTPHAIAKLYERSDMRKPMGLLGGGFDFSATNEDEFNEWYDAEHVPERLRIPGFINAVRWIGVDNPKLSLAIYDLENLDVLQKPEYKAVSPEHFSPWAKRLLVRQCKRLCRFNAEQMGDGRAAPDSAAALMVFATNVAPGAEGDFNDWYDTEHIPRLSKLPGLLMARRFKAAGPSIAGSADRKYIATYHLTSPDVCESAEWKEAADTAWTRKMKPHMRDVLRLRCRRYVRTQPIE
jgi:hypothetical protein